MIFLLNYLPIVLFLIGTLITYRYVVKGKSKSAAYSIFLTCLVVVLYLSFATSYMPKGVVHKPTLPAFEESDAQIEDRLRAPLSEEEHDARLDEGLDWKKRVEQEKQKSEDKSDTE